MLKLKLMPKVYKMVQKRHVFAFLTIFFTFSIFIAPFMGTPSASAAPTSAEWIDNFNLNYLGTVFQSDDENDNWHFYDTTDTDGCKDVILGIDWQPSWAGDQTDDPGDDDTTADYEVHVPDPTGCVRQSSTEIDLVTPENAEKTLFWDGEYIVTKSGRPIVFQKEVGAIISSYMRVDGEENRCIDSLEIAVGATTGQLTLRVEEYSRFKYNDEAKSIKIMEENSGYSYISQADYDNIQNKCYVSETFDVVVEDASKSTVPGTGDTNGDTADIGLGLGGGGDNPTCESSGFVLSWIFCPIVNAALDTMDWMFRVVIEPFLLFSPLTTNSDDLAYKAWRGFRTLGNIILVFALLIIVFGQSIGGGLVDAYTAKKAMPRILIAAILINLSYFIVALSVDVFNVLGMGVAQLINAPLNGGGSFNFTPNNILSGTGLLGIVLGGTWLLAFVTTGGFFIVMLMSFIIPMLLTTIAIFGTLIIRRGLIILLAIISPVALALYALPGTEKYAKKWLDLLIKSLVVYPIIMVIFAVADLLSQLMFSTAGNGGSYSINQFVALVVLFIPFFLIPFAFKLAGGAVATISGAVTGFNKKRYDKYMGSEFDPHSRKNQVHGHFRSMRTARAGHRGETFKRMAEYRMTPGVDPHTGRPTLTPEPGLTPRQAAAAARRNARRAGVAVGSGAARVYDRATRRRRLREYEREFNEGTLGLNPTDYDDSEGLQGNEEQAQPQTQGGPRRTTIPRSPASTPAETGPVTPYQPAPGAQQASNRSTTIPRNPAPGAQVNPSPFIPSTERQERFGDAARQGSATDEDDQPPQP